MTTEQSQMYDLLNGFAYPEIAEAATVHGPETHRRWRDPSCPKAPGLAEAGQGIEDPYVVDSEVAMGRGGGLERRPDSSIGRQGAGQLLSF